MTSELIVNGQVFMCRIKSMEHLDAWTRESTGKWIQEPRTRFLFDPVPDTQVVNESVLGQACEFHTFFEEFPIRFRGRICSFAVDDDGAVTGIVITTTVRP